MLRERLEKSQPMRDAVQEIEGVSLKRHSEAGRCTCFERQGAETLILAVESVENRRHQIAGQKLWVGFFLEVVEF
jgi:hypothetical protein